MQDSSCCDTRAASRNNVGVQCIAILCSLLASNCCVIQILLNYLSLGCAGFSVLGKLKPLSKILTVASVCHLLWRRKRGDKSWAFALVAMLLLASQDVLSIYNKGTYKNLILSRWLRNAVVKNSPSYMQLNSYMLIDQVSESPTQGISSMETNSSMPSCRADTSATSVHKFSDRKMASWSCIFIVPELRSVHHLCAPAF
jgi:hypothetical protein